MTRLHFRANSPATREEPPNMIHNAAEVPPLTLPLARSVAELSALLRESNRREAALRARLGERDPELIG